MTFPIGTLITANQSGENGVIIGQSPYNSKVYNIRFMPSGIAGYLNDTEFEAIPDPPRKFEVPITTPAGITHFVEDFQGMGNLRLSLSGKSVFEVEAQDLFEAARITEEVVREVEAYSGFKLTVGEAIEVSDWGGQPVKTGLQSIVDRAERALEFTEVMDLQDGLHDIMKMAQELEAPTVTPHRVKVPIGVPQVTTSYGNSDPEESGAWWPVEAVTAILEAHGIKVVK